MAADGLVKFGVPGDEPYPWPKVWQREKTTGPERLRIACADAPVDLLLALAGATGHVEGFLLYVVARPVHVAKGRYQSPRLSLEKTSALLGRFRRFLESDGRHHVWIAFPPSPDLVVYDHHNLLFAYGALESYESVLRTRGYSTGSVRISVPHTHHFHSELSGEEDALLASLPWIRSPERPGDHDGG